MGKQKLKLYLLFLFLIGIIFVACNQDDSIENHQHSETKNPNFKLEKVKFDKFSKNSNLIKQLNKIIPNKNSSELGKTVTSTDGSFSINTDFATYLETGNGKHSYTFKINRTSSQFLLENLVLNSNDSLGYNAYIVQYNINENEYLSLINNISIDLSNKMTLLKLNDDSFISNIFSKESFDIETMCLNYITVCGSGEHWGANGSNGNLNSCNIPGTFNTYYAWVNCTETIDLGDVPSGGGGSGGGGGTSSGDSGSDYDPTDPDIHGGGSVSTAPTFDEDDLFSVENSNALQNLISIDPFAILEVPCVQIPYWQSIAQYEPPQTIKDKIFNIDSQTGWFTSAGIQTLNDANNGAVVNMDFFPVTISQMPKKDNGEEFTQKELFDYIRLNINDFFDDLVFTPVVSTTYGLNDDLIWNSDNPIGAILSINIAINEGSVVCSNYNSTTGEWIFSTIKVPWDGTHPVSGNRAFGYYTDINGNMVIYTRGVDRLTDGTYMNGGQGIALEQMQQEIAFSQADSKWTNFQNKISDFVNDQQFPSSYNGSSVVNLPVKYRPNWAKVKDVLMGLRPISDLGCN